MILDISSSEFKKIFDNESLYLPIRWEGVDFVSTLEELYHTYQFCINESVQNNDIKIDRERIKICCSLILKSVKSYLDGFPYKAFLHF